MSDLRLTRISHNRIENVSFFLKVLCNVNSLKITNILSFNFDFEIAHQSSLGTPHNISISLSLFHIFNRLNLLVFPMRLGMSTKKRT